VDKYESLRGLNDMVREAVVDLLYRLADDELIMGHRDAEWTGPVLESENGPPFASMARDELRHAQAYYQMLHELGEPEPTTLIFERAARQFRCASLVSSPKGDWALSLLRRFFYDTGETVRLTTLSIASLTPLARAAARFLEEEKAHLAHGREWVLRLADAGDGNRQTLQNALAIAYPCALALFEPTEANEVLAQAGISPKEEQLCHEWESAVAPVLVQAGLEVDPGLRPVYGGRVRRHPGSLSVLLGRLQRSRVFDSEAKG
jgi:ring-1,2-phenylacetyl-CoA epoxidase subunit PaaC